MNLLNVNNEIKLKNINLIKVPIVVIIIEGITKRSPSMPSINKLRLSNIESDFFLTFFKILFVF